MYTLDGHYFVYCLLSTGFRTLVIFVVHFFFFSPPSPLPGISSRVFENFTIPRLHRDFPYYTFRFHDIIVIFSIHGSRTLSFPGSHRFSSLRQHHYPSSSLYSNTVQNGRQFFRYNNILQGRMTKTCTRTNGMFARNFPQIIIIINLFKLISQNA